MKYRKLQIAWSVAWGIACLLLVVLWVRSYWWNEEVFWFDRGSGNFIGIGSCAGRATLIASDARTPARSGFDYWGLSTEDSWTNFRLKMEQRIGAVGGFGVGQWNKDSLIMLPHWFLATFVASLATIVWLPWFQRFTLRTLLIATTLVAVGLGWIVYTLRT